MQSEFIKREEAASPMAATEAIHHRSDRGQKRIDIPNAFMQTPITQGSDKVMMNIRGPLVVILCENCPGVYDNFVIYEENKNKEYYM